MNANSLRLALRPSPGLTGLLVAGHAGAVALVWLVLPPWWGRALASSALGASLVIALRRHALRSGGEAIVEVELSADGGVNLRRQDGGLIEGRLLASTFVSSLLVILNFATQPRGRLAVLVPGDALTPEDHRRLRVWLRWRGAP